MPKIEESIYAEAKKQYNRRFGRNSVSRHREWRDVQPEPMLVMQEYREILEQIKLLNIKRRALKSKLNELGFNNLNRTDYFKKEIVLYVLELEHDCWYVGLTRDINKRFNRHVKGKGASWTKLHPPIKITEVRKTGLNNDSEASKLEDQLTLEIARKYGKNFVRGGGYCQTKPRWPADLLL